MKGSRLAMLTVVSAVSVGLTILLAPFLIVANAPIPNPAVMIDGNLIVNLISFSYSVNHTGAREDDSVRSWYVVGEIVFEGDYRDLVDNFLLDQTRSSQIRIVYRAGIEFGEPIEEQGAERQITLDEVYCTSISGKIEGQSAVTTITFQCPRYRYE